MRFATLLELNDVDFMLMRCFLLVPSSAIIFLHILFVFSKLIFCYGAMTVRVDSEPIRNKISHDSTNKTLSNGSEDFKLCG